MTGTSTYLRLSILQGQSNWAAAAALAKATLAARPAAPEFYVMGAFAYPRQETSRSGSRVSTSRGSLQRDLRDLMVHLACYECCLGNLDRVGALLDRAFLLDEIYRIADLTMISALGGRPGRIPRIEPLET